MVLLAVQSQLGGVTIAESRCDPLTPEETARRAKLYGAVGRAVYTCQTLELQLGILAAALDARSRIVHHFFIRNIDAFLYDNVLEAALSALRDDDRKLSACLILVHNVYERLCEALHIDSDKIVIGQYRVHEDGAQ